MFRSICACTLMLMAAVSLSLPAGAGKKLRVLFIGNSYTYTNDLPQIIASLAAASGDTLLYDSYTVGGYKFIDHAFDTACANKIRSAKWDYVVLQEQSRMPSMPTGHFFTNSYHYAQSLDTMIQGNDACTDRIFYMTWGYKNGDADFCPLNPWSCTYEGMDSSINLRYRSYADTALPPVLGVPLTPGGWFAPIRPSQVSPVGEVWHYIRRRYPSIELYQPDESHPTEAGSYAGACTFYAVLFRKDPTLVPYNYSLSTTQAGDIKQAAKLVAYDSLAKWNIGMDLRAAFRPSPAGGNLIIFLSMSTPLSATSRWDFGDGTTGTGSSNFHTYAAPGIYHVRLIASNGSCSDTAYGTVSTYPAGLTSMTGADLPFTISPNPAAGVLSIRARIRDAYGLTVMNAAGQVVYHKEDEQAALSRIDISGYSRGVYIISFTCRGAMVYRTGFVKQ